MTPQQITPVRSSFAAIVDAMQAGTTAANDRGTPFVIGDARAVERPDAIQMHQHARALRSRAIGDALAAAASAITRACERAASCLFAPRAPGRTERDVI